MGSVPWSSTGIEALWRQAETFLSEAFSIRLLPDLVRSIQHPMILFLERLKFSAAAVRDHAANSLRGVRASDAEL